jgi:hypothetical protein
VTILLIDGQPQRQSQLEGSYKFYAFWYGFPEEEMVSVTVQCETGRTQMYISNQISNSNPTHEKFQWKALSQGPLTSYDIPRNSKLGWYFFGVQAELNTTYTIRGTSQYSNFFIDHRDNNII